MKKEGVLVTLPPEGRGSVQYLGLCFLDTVVGLYFWNYVRLLAPAGPGPGMSLCSHCFSTLTVWMLLFLAIEIKRLMF